jgi:transposase
MTSAGLDVHARSIDAAAVCVATGEVIRRRFGAAPEPVIDWLKRLPGPVHACYEAGPTGFRLQRAATAAGIRIDVVAPSKTPRAAGDRVKTDRKDAELLARLLIAGQLTAVRVPEQRMEARRELFRCHEQARGDLQRARHRTSKMLLRHGRVWSDGGTWTQRHRAWLARQRFEHVESELAFAATWRLSTPRPRASWRSPSGSRVWPRKRTCGRPSRGCAPFAGSTRSRHWGCTWSSAATGRASPAPRSSRRGSG